MALTGLQIFKLLPNTNCKECGFPTCLAFAMKLAAGKEALEKCPHASDALRAALGAADPGGEPRTRRTSPHARRGNGVLQAREDVRAPDRPLPCSRPNGAVRR